MPMLFIFGSIRLSSVRTPLLALFRSVHWPAGAGSHIEPVRSIASTMSTGALPHGWQAVAFACRSQWSMLKILANHVGTLAVPLTTTALFVPQLLPGGQQRVWYV